MLATKISIFYLIFLVTIYSCITISEDSDQEELEVDSSVQSISTDQYAPMIIGFISALQKINLQLRHEIGENIYKIAQLNSSNIVDSSENVYSTNSSSNVDATQAFLPESVLKANEFFKSITLGHPAADETIINGFKSLIPQVKDAFLVQVINNENMKLFRLLLDHNLITPGPHHYEVALEKLSENHASRTDGMDEILEKLSSFDLDAQAIRKTVSEIKMGKEFNIVTAQLAIKFNNFPIFKRLLANGLKPNTRIPDVGSLLSVSVHGHCLKCTEALISMGADVNAPIELDGMLKFNALEGKQNPFGWTPLMVAAAHGHVRMVKALVASGKAQITKASLEDKDLHARAVARKIVDKIVRKEILKELKLCPVDQGRVAMILDNNLMTMDQAINSKSYKIVDAVLLSGKEQFQKSWLTKALANSDLKTSEILAGEQI